jgi:transcriptional regulator with XRE-family HTH domain
MDVVSFKVGLKVGEIRESKHVEQTQLAKALGVSRSSVVNMEAGRQGILLHRLYDVAIALEVEVSDLLPSIEWYKQYQGKKLKKVTTIEIIED